MDAFKDKVHEIEEGAKKQFDNLFHNKESQQENMSEQAKKKTEDAKKSATDQAKNVAGRE
ncbi:hypothetical protein BDW42DRAFT_171053 [Aspergillus taichungensis]|uniref:Uncharacterized protein n=1 Tax=Aspergillus taichungensis TaxID=482145 RepID=A0A2J5HSU1_9EURO|nr:hypothetical protein BDW42DRAFT_171053 [Aspergillus taichungensis]